LTIIKLPPFISIFLKFVLLNLNVSDLLSRLIKLFSPLLLISKNEQLSNVNDESLTIIIFPSLILILLNSNNVNFDSFEEDDDEDDDDDEEEEGEGIILIKSPLLILIFSNVRLIKSNVPS
jgi:hypothetical protein